MFDVSSDAGKCGRVVDDAGAKASFARERKSQPAQHLVFGDNNVALGHDFLGTREDILADNRVHRRRAPNPLVTRIVYQLLSKAAGGSVIDEIPDIVLVLENRLDHEKRPRTPMMIGD